MKQQKVYGAALVALLGLGVSCSSSDSNPGGVDASSVSNVAGTFSALEGLLDDVSADSSRLSARGLAGDPQPGDKSLLGCHFKQDMDRTFRELGHVQAPLCYMGIVEKNNPDFVIPEESYACYRLNGMQDHTNDLITALFRVGIFKDSSGRRTLKYQMRKGSTQTEDFRISEVEGGVEAFTAHKETDIGFDDEEHTFQGSFEVEAYGTSSDELNSAKILAKFSDDFGKGFNRVSADRTASLATMLGFFAGNFNEFSHETGVCAFASQGKGSGHVSSTATFLPYQYPGDGLYYCPNPGSDSTLAEEGVPCPETTFDNEENFYITGSPPQCLIDGDPNADLVALVDDCDLPTEAEAPAKFQVSWDGDCDSFVDIDLTEFNKQFEDDCRKFENHGDNYESCEQQASEDEHDPPPT